MAGLEALLYSMATAPTEAQLHLRVVDGITQALEGDRGGLYLFEPSGEPREIYAPRLPDRFIFEYERIARDDDRVFARARGSGQPVHDLMAYSPEQWQRSVQYRAFAKRYGIYHYVCAPIVIDDRVVGTLNVARADETKPFGERQLDRAGLVVSMLAMRLRALRERPDEEAERLRPGPGAGDDPRAAIARLRAQRALLRSRAACVAEGAVPVPADELARLLDGLAARRITPIDTFDSGDRRYLLMPAPREDEAQPAPAPSLSARELEIVRRVAAGESNKAIAYELSLSPSLVAKLLSRARRKLGVASRVQVVGVARRLGLAAGG